MNKRERAKRAKQFAAAVESTKKLKQFNNAPTIMAWEQELAHWQQSKSQVKDETTHPVVKGNHEYFEELDLRNRRYSQGGIHDRLRQAAAKKEKERNG